MFSANMLMFYVDYSAQDIIPTEFPTVQTIQFEESLNEISTLQSSIQEQESQVGVSILDIAQKVAKKGDSDQLVENLKLTIGNLEGSKVELLMTRYNSGLEAMSQMERGITILTFMNNIQLLLGNFSLRTDIWDDKHLRNTADKVSEYAEMAGGVLVMTGTFSGGDSGVGQAGVGAGLIAVAQFISRLWGGSTDKYKEKVERVLMTRQAYDDLSILVESLKEYALADTAFISELTKFSSEYRKMRIMYNDRLKSEKAEYEKDSTQMAKAPFSEFRSMAFHDFEKEMAVKLAELIELVDEFRELLQQIPTFLYELKGICANYLKTYQNLEEKYRNDFASMEVSCDGLIKSYNEKVKPILNVAPQTYSSLLSLIQ
ncbi:MAG: hypothetical protein RL220_642 [Bacteroidota bacterium]